MNSNVEYHLSQLKKLAGGKITNLAEAEDGFFGLIITMPNGKQFNLLFLSDPEGNAPGSFEINPHK